MYNIIHIPTGRICRVCFETTNIPFPNETQGLLVTDSDENRDPVGVFVTIAQAKSFIEDATSGNYYPIRLYEYLNAADIRYIPYASEFEITEIR